MDWMLHNSLISHGKSLKNIKKEVEHTQKKQTPEAKQVSIRADDD
jgi:hypothetical protein